MPDTPGAGDRGAYERTEQALVQHQSGLWKTGHIAALAFSPDMVFHEDA